MIKNGFSHVLCYCMCNPVILFYYTITLYSIPKKNLMQSTKLPFVVYVIKPHLTSCLYKTSIIILYYMINIYQVLSDNLIWSKLATLMHLLLIYLIFCIHSIFPIIKVLLVIRKTFKWGFELEVFFSWHVTHFVSSNKHFI